ncbi:MAG TPA: tRNA (adenosine(37)-N6)-threonylcarbamoyltransferase complex dimerization subunit type 1 TsaB [Candidatus Limnocylindrales bacterium]|nr:tRNA (adenosine(37)-N6)-threonylcarbamoyltransferase complex dimerization subunit type 1 TsaB [Candidatus Limnocylindrales bacterium]
MLIVSVDTSGRQGSIALCRGDGDSFEVLQLTSLEGGTYSAQLLPRIAETLQQNSLNKAEVDGFVVVSGPGSFTGLRVGLATVKGLCEVLRKPLATVSMLEALVLTHGRAGESAIAVLDAGRGAIYVGEYRLGSGHATLVREYIAKLDEFAGQPPTVSGNLLTVDEKVAEGLHAANRNVILVAPVDAGEIGHIGIRKLLTGETADPATIDVNYIRRSDAELFSTAKKTQC